MCVYTYIYSYIVVLCILQLYKTKKKKEELNQENQKHQLDLKMKNSEISELTKELNLIKRCYEVSARKVNFITTYIC